MIMFTSMIWSDPKKILSFKNIWPSVQRVTWFIWLIYLHKDIVNLKFIMILTFFKSSKSTSDL